MDPKKIKLDNYNKIFQDIIDYKIIKSIIDYLLIKKNNNNNYNIKLYYKYINELFNYILVSKKWYRYISLTISNNIIDNKSFEYWFKIKNNRQTSPFENNPQNIENQLYILYFKKKKNQINQEYSIIKINQSITTNYFKNKLYLKYITVKDLKEIQKKLEDNQLQYDRIVYTENTKKYKYRDYKELFNYLLNHKDQEKIRKLFKILEFNYIKTRIDPDGFVRKSNEEGIGDDLEYPKLFFNNLTILNFDEDNDNDYDTLKILRYLKSKNIICDGSADSGDEPSHLVYAPLFNPYISGQQVESIKIVNKIYDADGFVEPPDLFKVNQFQNLHSIKIPMHYHYIFSYLSDYFLQYNCENYFSCSIYNTELLGSFKSDLNEMVKSLVTSKSLRNLTISSVCSPKCIEENICSSFYDKKECDFNISVQDKIKNFNNTKQIISNSFKPLFSELNTSIESINLDCYGSMDTNTFSDLLNNKSIKNLELKNSDFIYHKFKESNIDPKDPNYSVDLLYEKEIISINQYLIENILTSPLTSIRHFGTQINNYYQLKSIFNLLKNNIFKIQIYSIKFNYNADLTDDLIKEINDLKSYISTQQQHQQPNKFIFTNLKDIKVSTLKNRDKIENDNVKLYFILN